jgi:MFS family permease
VSSAAGDALRVAPKSPSRVVVISVLGVTQIFAWGSSYYLPAVLAKPIASDTGWSLSWVVGGLSLGLLIASLVSPWVGRAIARRGGRPVLAVSAALLAVGLSALALAQSLPAFLIAWSLIGLGMGGGSLRSGLCDSRTPVRAWGALGNHDAHTIWRLREYRLLASSLSLSWPWAASGDATLASPRME